jgi:hypothetical protein
LSLHIKKAQVFAWAFAHHFIVLIFNLFLFCYSLLFTLKPSERSPQYYAFFVSTWLHQLPSIHTILPKEMMEKNRISLISL